MATLVGIDIGATKTAVARVDTTTGEVTSEQRWPTRAERGSRAVLDDCVRAVAKLAGDKPTTVGIGICELVDRNGQIRSGFTLDWRDLPLANSFAPHHVVVESDVRAAARAEAAFGAARHVDEALFLSVGSGISYCLISGGQPRPGAHGNALVVGAPPVEEIASGAAIAATAGVSDAEQAFADERHSAVIGQAASALGIALAALVNALDPNLVIVGGGLGLVDRYRDAFTHVARDHLYARRDLQPSFVPSALGPAAGVIGAALAAAAADTALPAETAH